uniref:uncharacterized protein LOC120334723 n=1 Tax=Styela clava TaxID=7725 RepID=UPI00193A377B|nr:uncharacterized protein LOC120334723 [Styela clava]XP_039258154.1 uncharacterized protein LOC120334723 [Styela clava]
MINNDFRYSTNHIQRLIPLLFILFVTRVTEGALYSHGFGFADNKINWPKWDLGSEQIELDTSIPLLGDGKLSSVWVNSFGSLTFRQLIDPRIEKLLDNIALAPYFIRSREGAIGAVYYRQTTKDSILFQQIADDISSSIILPSSQQNDFVTSDFIPTYALIVTWSNVASVEDQTLLNSFQIILTTDGIQSYAIFNYEDPLTWSSAGGKFAGAGIYVAKDAESFCSYELPSSQTEEVLDYSAGLGKYVFLISEPLRCDASTFQSACPNNLQASDWGSTEPYFSIAGTSWDVYGLHTCNQGFHIRPGVNSERIDCVYQSDYYTSDWDKAPEKCLDLNATKTFDITVKVSKIGNDSIKTIGEPQTWTPDEYNELKTPIENAIKRILNLTDVIITVTNITSDTGIPGARTQTDVTLSVDVRVHIPPYIHKKITPDEITNIILTNIELKGEVGGITFVPTVLVTEETDPCLQGCICRFKPEPKVCPRGKIPQIKPDSCCGGCNGKPYSSTIKACCNNLLIYDPTKAKCCNGRVRKGATGPCPKN